MREIVLQTILSLILLSSIPSSDAFCYPDSSYYPSIRIICSLMNSEELPLILNQYLDTEPNIDSLLLSNNNISLLGNTLFTSDSRKQIRNLTIINSQVEFILIGTFEELTNLQYLEISNNKIKDFDGEVLQGLTSLRQLKLKGNKLESIAKICAAAKGLRSITIEETNGNVKNIPSTAFEDCVNMEYLKISGLETVNLESGFVSNSPKLGELIVTNNYLTDLNFLESSGPLGITKLDASNNHITEFSASLLQGSLKNLKILNLTNNEISDFMTSDGTAFTHDLEKLYLASNKISILNKDLFRFFSTPLVYIDIDYNPVKKIEPGSFGTLVYLKFLKIKNSLSKIKALKQGMFDNLKFLRELDLSNANITSIERNTFQHMANLRELHLQNNNITKLYNGTFQGLIRVTDFNLTNNPVFSVEPGSFYGLGSLTNIQPKTFFNGVKKIRTAQFSGLAYNYVQSIDLSNLGIKSVDQMAFDGLINLQDINLNGNNIKLLVENTFVGLQDLTYLNISYNKISRIHKNAFSGLSSLRHLDLSNNRLLDLHPDVFGPLISLHNLHLSYNGLISTESGQFRKLSCLQELFLIGNKITHLKANSFIGLKGIVKINLLGNYIEDVQPGAFVGLKQSSSYFSSILNKIFNVRIIKSNTFIGLDNLGCLDLSSKDIRHINSNAFMGIQKLTELSLNNCNITVLDAKAFAGPPITDLNLANNNLTTISAIIFEDSNIMNLNLSGNRFESIKFHALAPIANLQTLYLYNSSIRNLSSSGYHAEKNHLQVIDLKDNFIENLESNLFQNMHHLMELYLSGNPIKNIHEPFFTLQALKILSFSVRNITLKKRIFQGLESIERIEIKGSNITTIATQAFSNISVNILSITNSSILKISSDAFQNLQNLTVLDLSNNQLDDVKISSNAFTNLQNLIFFDLSNNQMNDFEVKLTNLHKLETLNLSGNKFEVAPCFSFSGLNALQNLYLNNNLIDNITHCSFNSLSNLKHLDLSFNSLTSIVDVGIFSPFSHLEFLNLTHNQIHYFSASELYHIKDVKVLDISNNRLGTLAENFEIGNWDQFEIRYNPWECNNLLRLRKFFKNAKFSKEIDYETNIDGISCCNKFGCQQ